MELKRLISLIWILINSHYGISKKRYTYFHQKRRLWELFLIVFAIVALAVSAVPLYGFFTKALLDQYIILGMEHLFLANLMLLSSVIGFVFGTFLLVSTFFFSNEMRILLPLPLKPYEVLIGKFAVVLLDQMIISLALLLPGFVYYGLRTSVHVSYWIYMAVVFLLSQVFPLAIVTITTLPLSRILGFRRNRDFLIFAVSVAVLVGVIGFQFYFVNAAFKAPEVSAEAMAKILADPDSMLNRISVAYPPALLAVNTLSKTGLPALGWFLGYLSINGLALVFTLFVGEKLYYRTYSEIQESFAKKKTSKRSLDRMFTITSPFRALLKREWRYLLRIPAFSVNAFANVLVFPVILVIMGLSIQASQDATIAALFESFKDHSVVIGSLVAILAGATNLLSASLFSREGKLVQELRVLPIESRTILMVKLIQITEMSLIGPVAASIAIRILLGISALQMIFIAGIGSVCTFFLNLVQVVVDAVRPSLDWDNPQKAMKQNLNGLFSILIVFGFVGGVGFLVYTFRGTVSPLIMSLVLLSIGIVGSIVFWPIAVRKTEEFFQKDLIF